MLEINIEQVNGTPKITRLTGSAKAKDIKKHGLIQASIREKEE